MVAQKPGRYFVDVVLLVNQKHVSEVSVVTEALAEESESGSTDREYIEVTRITVPVDIIFALQKDLSKQFSKDQQRENGRERGHGRDRGHGMSL